MHHPFLGTLRRSLAVAGPLVIVATVAITAFTWRGAPRDVALGPVDSDRVLGPETDPGDVQLRAGSSPFFTTTGALTTVDTFRAGAETVAVPEGLRAGGSDVAAHPHRPWTGFTTSAPAFDSSGSRPRNGASAGRSSFGAAISGMGMSGGWGGVSGSAGGGAKASPASSITRRTTGASPATPGPQRTSGTPGRDGAPAAASAAAGTSGDGPAAATGDAAPPAFDAAAPAQALNNGVAGAPIAAAPGGAAPAAAAPGGTPSGAAPGGNALGGPRATDPRPGPAPTPEPVTMVLVGIGVVALYRLRRHLV